MAARVVDPNPAPSGIQGVTVVDHCEPLLRHQQPVPVEPILARVFITHGGQLIAQVDTDLDGRFEVLLPAGSYQLGARNVTGAPVPTALPITVNVHPHEIHTVIIQFDSGIR